MTISLAILLAILTLWPAASYVLLPRRDPFSPLIFFGLLTFFVADWGILTDYDRSLRLISDLDFSIYLVVTILAVLGFYLGWFLRRRREHRTAMVIAPRRYRPQVLLNWSMIFALVGVSVAMYTREDCTVTGYLRDLGALWVAGIILAIEATYVLPNALAITLLIGCFCLIPPIYRFFSYGQRGDTFRMASLVIPYFLLRNIRPPRAAVIPLAIFLALLLGTLERTRTLMGTGEATGRIDAIFKVIPSFFDQTRSIKFYGGKEYIFGSAMIATVRDEQSYEYGNFLYNIGVRFIPKEIIDDKDSLFSIWNNSHYIQHVSAHSGFEVPGGAAPSGFAHVFVEFGWASPLFWMLIGYISRALFARATHSTELAGIGYLVAFYVVLLYLITQDLYAPSMNAIYLFPALFIAYKTARITESEPTPALLASHSLVTS